VAVDGVTFEVERGVCFALLGPNGAGKTTTVEILECLRRKTSGEAYVLGYSVDDPSGVKEIKQRIGVMPQDFSTFERLTVEENVELIARIYGTKPDVRALLEKLGLWERRKSKFSELSGGMKRRVGIAMALVNEPELVFLDEPTTGLDPEGRREVWRFIEQLAEEGRTVFLTTHYMEEAEKLAHKCAIIVRGKIIAMGSPREIVARHGGAYKVVVHEVDAQVSEAITTSLAGVASAFYSKEKRSVTIVVPERSKLSSVIETLTSVAPHADFEVLKPTLEEAFLRLVGRRITDPGELA
jgi:ABC-2 type transport system ATP-binding protein